MFLARSAGWDRIKGYQYEGRTPDAIDAFKAREALQLDSQTIEDLDERNDVYGPYWEKWTAMEDEFSRHRHKRLGELK